MSNNDKIAKLKEYIKTKLGAPVLQINVSDEQMDIAIDDAFQYFYERQHFDAMEKVYLGCKVSDSLHTFFQTGEIESISQSTHQPVSAEGMVATLQVVAPGTGYGPTSNTEGDLIAMKTSGGTGEVSRSLLAMHAPRQVVSSKLLSITVVLGSLLVTRSPWKVAIRTVSLR